MIGSEQSPLNQDWRLATHHWFSRANIDMRSFPLYQFLCHITSNDNVKSRFKSNLTILTFLICQCISIHLYYPIIQMCAWWLPLHQGAQGYYYFHPRQKGQILFRQSYSSCNNLCMPTTYFYSTRLKHTFGKSTNIHKLFKTINYLNNRIDTIYEMLMTHTHIYSKSKRSLSSIMYPIHIPMWLIRYPVSWSVKHDHISIHILV